MTKGQPLGYELPECESCTALRQQLSTARQAVWEEAAKLYKGWVAGKWAPTMTFDDYCLEMAERAKAKEAQP